MSCTGMNDDLVPGDLEHQPVLLVNADTPPAREVAFERLWIADAVVAISVDARKKSVDALCHSCIELDRFDELLPSSVVPNLLHATAPRRASLAAGRHFFLFALFSALAISCAISSSVCSW